MAANGQGNRFIWRVRAYYEDTDATGVVYHANYLRYLERARTEWLRHFGYDQQRLKDETGIAFTIASLQIEYRIPARLDDELDVSVELERLGKASMKLIQEARFAGSAELSAAAQVRVACVSMENFKPNQIPDEIIDAVSKETGYGR